jgi:hypothetical protein
MTLNEYKLLVVKIVENSIVIMITKTNYELLCDIKTLLGVACVLLLLEEIQNLFKFAQGCDTFIYDFVFTLKFCEANLFDIYCDTKKRYSLYTSLCLFILLCMLVIFCVWFGGKSMPSNLNAFFLLSKASYVCYKL